MGCAQELIWDDGERLYQFISSGLTNRAGPAMRIGAEMLMRLKRKFAARDRDPRAAVRLIGGVADRRKNPYGKPNVGVVQVHPGGAGRRAGLAFFLYGHDGDAPVCVYQTPVL